MLMSYLFLYAHWKWKMGRCFFFLIKVGLPAFQTETSNDGEAANKPVVICFTACLDFLKQGRDWLQLVGVSMPEQRVAIHPLVS